MLVSQPPKLSRRRLARRRSRKLRRLLREKPTIRTPGETFLINGARKSNVRQKVAEEKGRKRTLSTYSSRDFFGMIFRKPRELRGHYVSRKTR
ncbi:hypothetical protein PUN28_002343 [Cardiocondyla obscurior]|uniref:Ribosomal protein S19 n=1 Tax=Cardiocondyla obscurior TaxID=286306 RepID=A0AAW2GTU3_9HYME